MRLAHHVGLVYRGHDVLTLAECLNSFADEHRYLARLGRNESTAHRFIVTPRGEEKVLFNGRTENERVYISEKMIKENEMTCVYVMRGV